MTVKLPDLIPPFRYSLVEENMFRGGYPKPKNIRFLKRLRLKTILSLIPDNLMPEMLEFCENQGIQVVHLTVDKMKEDNIPLSYNKTLMALQIMIDPTNHPLYLHCLDGADVTGLVVACLRKLQMWNLSSAMCEFSRHLHTNVIASEEFEFVDNFKNFEITVPLTLPRWLWNGEITFRKHSCLRLKFLNPDMMTEEERELRELKEKKEKEKEDFYKKRKNDLLDNLFDTVSPVNITRHRNGSHFTNNTTNNGNGNTILSPSNNSASGSTMTSNMTTSEHGFSMSGRSKSNGAKSGSSKASVEDSSDRKDRYLVDVDVDVDGVMMDGLDQVDYYNHEFGRSSRFYNNEDDESAMLLDDENDIYGEDGTHYASEPISRTLEALALEGLTD